MLPAAARLRRSTDFTATLRGARTARGDGMVVLHATFVVFESAVLVVLSRSMEAETLASAQSRVAEAA